MDVLNWRWNERVSERRKESDDEHHVGVSFPRLKIETNQTFKRRQHIDQKRRKWLKIMLTFIGNVIGTSSALAISCWFAATAAWTMDSGFMITVQKQSLLLQERRLKTRFSEGREWKADGCSIECRRLMSQEEQGRSNETMGCRMWRFGEFVVVGESAHDVATNTIHFPLLNVRLRENRESFVRYLWRKWAWRRTKDWRSNFETND